MIRLPRDHVEDVADTFTLITGGSQNGKDLLVDTHGYSYVVKLHDATRLDLNLDRYVAVPFGVCATVEREDILKYVYVFLKVWVSDN
ncbi:hypothetical protein DPMN_126210 [Dreissena polymorpha]|uniref:Uncharacterized protein n=1 Tax=Dreissena polymorpha TaxID=45954 RepID=A0A9D4JTR1_DREPO|nr:hypothetical protein DPMN_126210 [Dreissena polymorpha]